MRKISLSYGSKFGLVLVSFLFFMFFSLSYAQTTPKGDTTKAAAPAKLKYMGALSCKMCHNLEKTTGKQYDIWAASKHAMAYKDLAGDKAKEVAKAKGIEDPQKSDKCLKCHITGFGASAAEKGPKYNMAEGVGCEACHGPGEKYKDMKIMKDPKLAKENGMIMPGEKECKVCHNPDSPTYKEFKFADAMKVIAHPIPKKTK
ncbi:MAG: cytochrome c family protein [candidate division Zixibacteria bacterium]|nr:cytochrome c family protein [candidate division Zixibacteria bacterium]